MSGVLFSLQGFKETRKNVAEGNMGSSQAKARLQGHRVFGDDTPRPQKELPLLARALSGRVFIWCRGSEPLPGGLGFEALD